VENLKQSKLLVSNLLRPFIVRQIIDIQSQEAQHLIGILAKKTHCSPMESSPSLGQNILSQGVAEFPRRPRQHLLR